MASEANDVTANSTQKLITFAIPCYNSAAYMDNCINSILTACGDAEDFEIVVVDDGSQKDETPQKADEWAAKLPGRIVAVHQENGGHGAAVLAGLEVARGAYYKVVDSDDWVDAEAVRSLLANMRRLLSEGEVIDLFVTNYVYEHVTDNTASKINYRSVMPVGRVFTWDEMGKTRIDQNLLMHALTYRTAVLRDGGVPLPRHTFYVDNIYAYTPLPRCQKIYYDDVDLYRYYIGREDQSVNEKVMTSRYEQQLRITGIMAKAYHLDTDVKSPRLRRYMYQYLTMMFTISSIFSHLSEEPEAEANLDALWSELENFDQTMYKRIRHGLLGTFSNLPGKLGRKMTIGIYRLAGKIVKFN